MRVIVHEDPTDFREIVQFGLPSTAGGSLFFCSPGSGRETNKNIGSTFFPLIMIYSTGNLAESGVMEYGTAALRC